MSEQSQVPESIKKAMPSAALEVFTKAFESTDGDDSAKSAAGYAAIKNEGFVKHGEVWVEKHYLDSEYQRLDQRAANYRPATAMNKACAVCAHYRPEYQECVKVAGHIRPDYVSDAFEAMSVDAYKGKDGEVPVMKVDSERQLVFGWAYVSIDKGKQVRDHSGDQLDPVTLEEAGYAFVLESREGNDMHVGDTVMKLVESMAFTDEKIEHLAKSYADPNEDAEGYGEALAALQKYIPRGLWHGYYVEDQALFQKVKNGERAMFSIEGTASPELIEEIAEANA